MLLKYVASTSFSTLLRKHKMSYIVYNKQTTRYLRNHPGVKTDKTHFSTEAAGKAALTREVKNTVAAANPILHEDFGIAETVLFRTTIEKTETVKNLMSGKDVVQSVNTPLVCDPSSETYWSI